MPHTLSTTSSAIHVACFLQRLLPASVVCSGCCPAGLLCIKAFLVLVLCHFEFCRFDMGCVTCCRHGIEVGCDYAKVADMLNSKSSTNEAAVAP